MSDILEMGKIYISKEIEALIHIRDTIGGKFVDAIKTLRSAKGKVIVTGMGKSSIVAHKIASTMASTGTMAIFLHPAEGLHGDLGIVASEDVVIALSNSGETTEVLRTLPVIKRIGAKLIAIVGNPTSTLARKADIVIDASITEEACPLNLAPTSSTTVAMAVGDALALVLMKLRNFQPEEFAIYHPGGLLGKRLMLKVADLMHSGDNNPSVAADIGFKDIICVMTAKPLGGVNVVDEQGRLVGVITEGDIRRSLDLGTTVFDKKAEELMTRNPAVTKPDALAFDAFRLMEARSSQISVLPVVENDHTCVGLLRLHDLLQIGFE